MKKTLLTLILIVSLIVLVFKFVSFLPQALGIKQTAGIRIQSDPDGADVAINGESLGKTPYGADDLEAKEVSIKLSSSSGSWEGSVVLAPQTMTFVNRELTLEPLSSAGEILSLDKGSGVTVISSPSGAEVSTDGESLGKTPGTFKAAEGEHTFVISHNGFINRSIKATVPKDYNLKLVVDLAASEEIVEPSQPLVSTVSKVTVLETPTGFLRVRDKASTAGEEINRVSPGDKLEFIEVSGSWTKIKLDNGSEGFVSSQYVTQIPR